MCVCVCDSVTGAALTMATSFTILWFVWLLILVRGCWGDQAPPSHRDAAMVTALKQVGQAMQCFGDTTQEGLSLQKQTNDKVDKLSQVILDLKSQLEDQTRIGASQGQDLEIRRLKTELDEKDKMVITLTQESTDLKTKLESRDQKVANCSQEITDLKQLLLEKDQNVVGLNQVITSLKNEASIKDDKVTTLTQENTDFKTQLENKEQKVIALTQEITDLKTQLGNKDQKVQELDNKLGESQRLVQQLEQQVRDLNNKVETQKPAGLVLECKQHQNPEKIKQMVKSYSNHKNWDRLKRELSSVLDQSSEEYRFLQSKVAHYWVANYANKPNLQVGPLWYLGSSDDTLLISLLLCAGLPVDTADSDKMTLLSGAAQAASVGLVKLLLDRGASVNMKDRHGMTPLMWAAYGDNLGAAKLIVQAGGDSTIKDNHRRNALDWAKTWERVSMMSYLQQLPH